MPRKESTTGAISAQAQQELVSDGIENYELPKSIVTKIAKSAIPENAKLQKETVLSLVKGSTVFINYLAATAHDVALSKQHKSISASDVLKALEMIEFGDLGDMLQNELQIYRANLKTDKSKKDRADKAAAKAAAASSSSAPKPKGKEKASASATAPTSASASASAAIPAQDADQEMDVAEDEAPEVDAEPDVEGEGEEGDEIDVDEPEPEDEEEDEPELEDKMAVEEEEVRKDLKGLDDV